MLRFFQNKVGKEIQRFQREIERMALERNRLEEWTLSRRHQHQQLQQQKRKPNFMGSMDSLLSAADSDYSSAAAATATASSTSSSRPPALPPRGRFVSSEELRPPPPRPQKKRVSIAEKEAEIIGTPVMERRRPAVEETPDLVPKAAESSSVVVEDRESSRPLVTVTAAATASEYSDESLATLPSVRELASKFLSRSSPEPTPRKSINKVVRISIPSTFVNAFVASQVWRWK